MANARSDRTMWPKPNSWAKSLTQFETDSAKQNADSHRILLTQNVSANAGLLTAWKRFLIPCHQHNSIDLSAGSARFLQETASWLSLATRSKASVELLIRYWQSSPST